VGLISLSLARRGGLKIAAQIYMFYLWVVSGLLTLFLSDRLILIGILVLSLNALLALFIEDLNVAVRWIGATAVLYAGMITLRFSGVFPPVVLGFVEPIFLFVAPLALFITLALLGNATTYYLRSTLSKSEDLRRELEESYEEARRATVFAQEANRLKSEFLSTMSHELRTPLNAIIGFSEIMVSGMSGSLDSEASKMLDRVLINARHLLGLINDILDLSKIEARQHELTIEAFSPLDLLKDTHSQMSSLAQRKGIESKLDVSNPLPPVLYSDPEVLKQIVINLLSNAIKFTDKGTVRLITNTGDSVLNISVEDTGIGIPPHALDFIFDPFRQVDGTTTRAHSGTGLGLAIAKSYVNQLGGSIHVKSVPGEGSTFIVLLPVAASAEQARGFIR
jgi:signal transduction histidine kinase